MVFTTQLRVLLWKNFTKKWRNPVTFAAELIWPLVIFSLMVGVKRSVYSTTHFRACSFPPRALPSAGTLSLLSSYMCDFNNPCGEDATLNDDPGKITNFNDSLVEEYVGEIQEFMRELSTFRLADIYRKAADVLFEFNNNATADNTSVTEKGDVKTTEMSLLNDMGKFSEFTEEVQQELGHLNRTIPPYLSKLFGGDAVVNQFSDAICGKRGTILQEHRPEEGMARIVGWMLRVISTSGGDPSKNVTDPNLAPECKTLFDSFENVTYSRLIWQVLKPMTVGYINYTPDNSATRKIIAQANRTFEVLDSMFALVTDLKHVVQHIIKIHNDAKKFQEHVVDQCGVLFDNASLCDDVDNLLKSLRISQEPWTNIVDVLSKVEPYTKCLRVKRFVGQPNIEAVIKESQEQRLYERFWAAIIFDNIDYDAEEVPKLVKYTIRMDPQRCKRTHRNRNRIWTFYDTANAAELQELTYGFSLIQDMVDHAIIRLHTNVSREPGQYIQPFPYPSYVMDKFIETIILGLPIIMVVSWTFSVSMIVSGIVYEKEHRLKENLKIMGLSSGVNWLAWFISSLLPMMLTALVLCILLRVGQLLTHSDPSVIFLFLLAFITSNISMAFLISVFFGKANLASVWSGLIFIGSYFPDSVITVNKADQTMTIGQKILTCFSPTLAMSQGLKVIGNYEIQAIGVQWNNLAVSPAQDGRFSVLISIIMMFLDSLIFAQLAMYIDNVFPGKYGIASPWNFFLRKSFWVGGDSILQANRRVSHYDRQKSISAYYGRRGSYEHQKMKTNRIGVAVRNLTKLYSGADRPAVDKLSLNFYEGQITSFLGHNGAGKTTTLSILTGLLAPTKGTVFINDLDIRTDIEKIRNNIGWCPQYNILIEYLTVEEHIWLFGQLRGRFDFNTVHDVHQLLRDIGLWDKRMCKSAELSGGMKRKLCVALAFVGGSTTVILDEPTAGVDPYSRRAIWDLLLKFRQGRTIILSTHHMDEADVLGDRVAIISNGKLRAVGSSLFLKDRFGSGYYLTLQKTDDDRKRGSSATLSDLDVSGVAGYTSEDSNEESVASDGAAASLGTDEDESRRASLVDFVNKHVGSAVLVEDNDLQMCFRLPDDTDHGTELVKLLDSLEESKEDLGVASYGISDTDLEEVFLKIAQPKVDVQDTGSTVDLSSSYFTDQTSLYSGSCESILSVGSGARGLSTQSNFQLLMQQTSALFAKRFHNSKRNIRAFATQILVPVLFVCLSWLVSLILVRSQDMPPKVLQPWHLEMHNQPLATFYSNDNKTNRLSNQLENDLLYSPHYGTRCLDKDVYSIRDKPCLSLENGGGVMHNESFGEESAKTSPPHMRIRTNDRLFDLTKWNITDYLLSSESQYRMSRYGGFSFGAVKPVGQVNTEHISPGVNSFVAFLDIVGALPKGGREELRHHLENVLQFAYTGENIKVWVNLAGIHSGTSYMNGANNLLLRTLLPQNETLDQYGIVTTSHPLKANEIAGIREKMNYSGTYIASAICMLFAFSFVVASFVVFVVDERTSNSKHLQFLCGIEPTLYWTVNWIWDMMNFIVTVVLCVFILLLFGKEEYVSDTSLPFFVTLLMMYGWSVTPLMYLLSRLFKDPSSSFVILSGLNVFLGTLCTLGSYLPPLITLKNGAGTLEFDATLQTIMSFVPQFCLTKGLLDLSLLHLESEIKSAFGETVKRDLMKWDFNGESLVIMFFMGVALNILVLLLEQPWFFSLINRLRCSMQGGSLPKGQEEDVESEDADVLRERQRVLSGEAGFEMLILDELTKFHTGKKSRPAVDRLCVGVPQAQCFGLLGVNGAGKSTTFKMLTGDLPITSGDAYIAGYSVRTKIKRVRQLIGYCPQADALNPLLTAREHLEFYAKARGTDPNSVKLVAIQAIKTLGLTAYADQPVQGYSGGNKRKLSIAIALIGSPPVIFLDEPTAGMDPVARRFLWNCIGKIVRSGRTVILTSHSMEECEALCNRLAIMVNGRFQCLGSLQHLKNRFGSGYTINLRVGGPHPDMTGIRQFISSTLPSAKLVEGHHNMLQYQLGNENLSLGKLFATMEKAKVVHGVEDYSVSQTTLEQVFINFAKNQRKSSRAQSLEQKDAVLLRGTSKMGNIFTVTMPEDMTNGPDRIRTFSALQHDDGVLINLDVFEEIKDEEPQEMYTLQTRL